jgi:hypothetical protein
MAALLGLFFAVEKLPTYANDIYVDDKVGDEVLQLSQCARIGMKPSCQIFPLVI